MGRHVSEHTQKALFNLFLLSAKVLHVYSLYYVSNVTILLPSSDLGFLGYHSEGLECAQRLLYVHVANAQGKETPFS